MPRKTSFSRRDVLKAGGGAAAAAPYFLPARVLGGERGIAPSDQITIGAIGVGVRGRFVGDDEANRHLQRPRRTGFQLPVNV